MSSQGSKCSFLSLGNNGKLLQSAKKEEYYSQFSSCISRAGWGKAHTGPPFLQQLVPVTFE